MPATTNKDSPLIMSPNILLQTRGFSSQVEKLFTGNSAPSMIDTLNRLSGSCQALSLPGSVWFWLKLTMICR
jgi:hypothetical protein